MTTQDILRSDPTLTPAEVICGTCQGDGLCQLARTCPTCHGERFVPAVLADAVNRYAPKLDSLASNDATWEELGRGYIAHEPDQTYGAAD